VVESKLSFQIEEIVSSVRKNVPKITGRSTR